MNDKKSQDQTVNPLKKLEECGQSPWLDYVRRSLIESGQLATMIARDGLKGITSNPSIFEKGIGESEEYNDLFAGFVADGDRGAGEIYEYLAMHDIRAAADGLRPVFDATHGRDGYVSLEVSPYLANDTQGTIDEARRLWKTVARDNLMVKVPATPAGIPAIRQLIADGLNINVTLLFAVEAYEQVAAAYIEGLEARAAAGQDVSKAASVASFFVSRIDSAIDKALDARIKEGADKAALDALRGRVAIANAKRAYQRYKAMFSGPRWAALAAKGAQTQRLLWASTSTKNPEYRDVIYVEELIGRDTVNTLPPATMDAFRDHGVMKPDAIEQDVAGAEDLLGRLAASGVDLGAVTRALVEDGVRLFADSFDGLLGAVARRRRERLEQGTPGQSIAVPEPELKAALDTVRETWRKQGNIRRLWAGDAALWTGGDEASWLGWLHIAEQELADIGKLEAFARHVRAEGVTDLVLLGMGGSSLGPAVLAATFGHQPGWPAFHMLDATDPAQVRAVAGAIDINHALFIVASKSGSTLEPNIFRAFFFDRARAALGAERAGAAFVAITDPGSSMEQVARADHFGHVFHGVKQIGGRYSVLSKFGLVPAAAIGIDVAALLRQAITMARSCGPEVPPAENPGVQLGLLLGAAAKRGRDKVTFIAAPEIAALGAWLEQLIAESTGKQGHGLIPIDGEAGGAPSSYGVDRVFVHLSLAGADDAAQAQMASALEAAGHPVVRIRLAEPAAIAGEFFRWEIATAVAGAVIGINPFDQPDVEASKIKTRALTDEAAKTGKLPDEAPIFRHNGIALYTDAANATELGRHNTLDAYLKSHLARAGAGDYIALLAYIEMSAAHEQVLQAMRTTLRERTRCATALGFGPRFLHSTGQAYKGGPNSGVFLQITCKDQEDLPVPGAGYTFGLVKAAQARGDLAVLEERKRRALRVHLEDVDAGLAELKRAVETALS